MECTGNKLISRVRHLYTVNLASTTRTLHQVVHCALFVYTRHISKWTFLRKGCHNKTLHIQIERVQNPQLYKRYVIKKQAMETSGIQAPEMLLWHGTSLDSVQGINRDGFNRSLCGKNGKTVIVTTVNSQKRLVIF